MANVVRKLYDKFMMGILLLAAIPVISGCQSNSSTIAEYTVEFDSIRMDGIIGLPLDLILKNDTLLVNQFYGNEFFTWVSLPDGKLLNTAIKRGEGPDEMTGPLKANMMGDDSLLIYDKQGFNAYHSDFKCNTVNKIMSLPFNTSKIFCFNDGKILTSKIPFGINDEKDKSTRFTIFADSLNKVHFGEYPRLSKSEQNYPVEALAQFHQTNGFAELPGNRFVILSSHVLSMYVVDKGEYKLLYEKSIAPYDYTYTPSTSNSSASVSLRDGYPKGAKGGILYHAGLLYFPFYEDNDDMTILCYDEEFNPVKKINAMAQFHNPMCLTSDGRIVAIGEKPEASYIFISKKPLDKI